VPIVDLLLSTSEINARVIRVFCQDFWARSVPGYTWGIRDTCVSEAMSVPTKLPRQYVLLVWLVFYQGALKSSRDKYCRACEIVAILMIVKLYLKIWHLILLREFTAYMHIHGRIKPLIFFEKSIMELQKKR